MRRTVVTVILIIVIVILAGVMVWGIAGGLSCAGTNNTWNNNWSYGCGGFRFGIGGSFFGQDRLPAEAQSALKAEKSLNGVDKIVLDFIDEDVEVVLTNEDIIRVEQTANGTLKNEDIMRFGMVGGSYVVQSGKYGRNNLTFHTTPSKITLLIPQKLERALELSTTSGSITVSGGEYKEMLLDSTTGEIWGKDIVATQISADSTSGSITLENIKCEVLTADSTAGNVTVTGDAGHNMEVDSTSGEISFVGSAEELSSNTVSGSVWLESDTMRSASANTINGSVDIVCGNAQNLKQIEADTVSGNVAVTLPLNNGFTAEFDTVSGYLNNDFEVHNNVHKDGYIYIEVNTVSGGLNIRKK